jgi:hypothetical protein
MASRRKYKAPKGYRDGGAVLIPDDVAPMSAGADVPPAATPQEGDNRYHPQPADADDAIRRALAGTQRAEEIQREARQPTPDQVIDAIPNLSNSKRAFLKENPHLVLNDVAREATAWTYQRALREGLVDDTPEMFERIRSGVREEMELRRHRGLSAPDMPEPEITRAAQQLTEEADAISRMMRAQDGTSVSNIAADVPPQITSDIGAAPAIHAGKCRAGLTRNSERIGRAACQHQRSRTAIRGPKVAPGRYETARRIPGGGSQLMPGIFSTIPHVNRRFLEFIEHVGRSPFDPATLIDVVGVIRAELGERAVRSIKVVLH